MIKMPIVKLLPDTKALLVHYVTSLDLSPIEYLV